jgi:CubicO group peptidase (beta-lactamase class C family)
MDGTLDIVRQQPLAFPPGAGSLYSNSGYHVLGAVTAKVAGTSYYDYVRAHLFRPAGMADSDFYTRPQWQAGRRFAHPYATDPSSGTRSDVVDQTVFIGNPAGNAFATAPDLVRFARALLGGTLLDAPYREVFLSPKAPLPPKAEEPAAVPFGTYSATAALINGSWVVGHNGAAPGSSTNLDWYPGGGWVAVKLSNYDVPTTQAVDLRLHEILTR